MNKRLDQNQVKYFLQGLDAKTVFIAVVTTMIIVYYINPLENVALDQWDRTFSAAMLSGISIGKRTQHFFVLFLVVIPVILGCVIGGYGLLLQARENYKDIFFKMCAVLVFPIIAAYISRYSTEVSELNLNKILILTMASFLAVLVGVSILDKHSLMTNGHSYILSVAYMVAITSSNILLRVQTLKSICIMAMVFCVYLIVILKTGIGRRFFFCVQNFICLLMWVPCLICVVLEGFFFLNEKNITVVRYYTNICKIVFIYMVIAAVVVFLLRDKGKLFCIFGYVGAITSLAALKHFSHVYQYIWNYMNYSNIYEVGNATVAVDTILNGKLPIIDYFSAHALTDVWQKIVYCFLHSDIKGILVNPYGGVASLLALLILFFILKKLFDSNLAAFFMCIFPFSVSSIKATGLCFIIVIMLISIINVDIPKISNFISFWMVALLVAFMKYDEGWSLGIACIITYIIINFIQKRWDNIKIFLLSGIGVGVMVLTMYFIYCVFNGILPVSRMKEWLSVSLGSNSTWATSTFGDSASLDFLLCYFIAPMCAVGILIITIIQFIRKRKYPVLAGITMVFAIAEILYIPRGITFNNLSVCRGVNGVLFNFIHWTVSVFVLYEFAIREKSEGKRLLAWVFSFGAVILAEGALVTGVLPTSNSTLYASAAVSAETMKLSNDMSSIRGKERIAYDDATSAFINKFQDVFEVLLEENDTFLDFANVTSLYMLTGRQRPFYVGQSPSLLTDLYSQECFLDEISNYSVPLAILGTTDVQYTQQMVDIPHNIRYYTVAEYIYENYRPLVLLEDFAIWCEKETYDKFSSILKEQGFASKGYSFADYGYDAVACSLQDEKQKDYRLFHQFNLDMLPYIWANNDGNNAINNNKLSEVYSDIPNHYTFKGSQYVDSSDGNYVAFECTNLGKDNCSVGVSFKDSRKKEIFFEYNFTVVPGTNSYIIRVSQDYFWDVFNIDSIEFFDISECVLDNVRILEGD